MRFPDFLTLGAALLLGTASICAQTPVSQTEVNPYGPLNPTNAINIAPAPVGYGIDFHGGPVMTAPKDIYYIFYGTWAGTSESLILADFAKSIGGSSYFNINTTYRDANNVPVQNSVSYKGAIYDNYSLGKSLSDANIITIVSNALNAGKLPIDTNAVYFVLTSADVAETSGFCTRYCGWHTSFTYTSGVQTYDIKYSFVGNGNRCPSACQAQTTVSPNGNPGADGMVSVIAHELEEATTDPDLNAWWRSATGDENADLCAWTFGTVFPVANGSFANMYLPNTATPGLRQRPYLIQRNWVNAPTSGYCALSY